MLLQPHRPAYHSRRRAPRLHRSEPALPSKAAVRMRQPMTAPPGSAPPLPPPRALRLVTPDGWSLHLACYPPAEPPRAALLLAPGMMLDGRAMDRPAGRGLASFFHRRGYAVYTL